MRLSTKMRRLSLYAWPLICYFCFVLAVVATESEEVDNIRLRVSIRDDILRGASSCQLTFSRVELLNLVSFVAGDMFSLYFVRVSTEFDVAPSIILCEPTNNAIHAVGECNAKVL